MTSISDRERRGLRGRCTRLRKKSPTPAAPMVMAARIRRFAEDMWLNMILMGASWEPAAAAATERMGEPT